MAVDGVFERLAHLNFIEGGFVNHHWCCKVRIAGDVVEFRIWRIFYHVDGFKVHPINIVHFTREIGVGAGRNVNDLKIFDAFKPSVLEVIRIAFRLQLQAWLKILQDIWTRADAFCEVNLAILGWIYRQVIV